jgi:signal transduction histidine kinase
LLEKVRQFPDDSIVVLTTNMVDRSGRATSNADLGRELSRAGKVPVIEGTDLSLGQGSFGGDLAAYRLTGQEVGKRIRRTLDTGQAPDGVVVDAAPRRKVFDWRQLERFGVPESRVPSGFEILYRQPTLWQQHRGAILGVLGGLLVQTLLISFLVTERRRRAEAQRRMRRQLKLEATVAKVSADFTAVTVEELPARLQHMSLGLSECLGIERASVWICEPEQRDYVSVYWWPDSKTPVRREALAEHFPYLYGAVLAGRNVTADRLDELPPNVLVDIAELRALGFTSLLMIPLMLGEEPIGSLVVGTAFGVGKWESDAVSTLEVLANILAQGISRSRSEERERQSEEQNRAMLASLPGFVLMIDSAGQIVRQSNRLEIGEAELPRVLARACVGQNLVELWRADGEAASQVALALEEIVTGNKASLVLEHRYETEAGTRWIEVHAESLCGDQRGAVVSQIDITGRKNQESENAKHRQTAWHLNRVAALGELTASLAHEINQPLAAILNSAEAVAVMLNRPSPDIGETLEAVRDIIDDDKRAGAVISRMRSMLKRGHERTQAVDLSATVDETLRLVVPEARLRHVHLRHVAAPDLPPILADPTQLQQVILNLLTNGIEATDLMPDYRHVEIRTSGLTTDAMQFLEVQDTGPGIPSERLSAIFEPFYTTKRAGLGLGLSICWSIVDSFGGKITAECPPEGGALFRVALPVFARTPEEVEEAMKAGA